MTEFRINDKIEALEVIRAAIWSLERDDTPYTYGAAIDPETNEQIVYFDLPRVSPLQFNISTAGAKNRAEVIERIVQAVRVRLTDE